jgi:hypothetical protein
MTIAKCHVCHVEDELQNLTKVSGASIKKTAYAHPRCIERHNKDVEKNRRALDVSMAASVVRDHDIDVSDSWAVESFLRKQNPKISKRFVAEVVAAARKRRDRDNMEALFETIEENVAAWPAEVSEDFIAEVTVSLTDIIYRLADDDWRSDGAIETKATRYAALLLIKQVAWRKYEAEIKAGHEEWQASEKSISEGV